MSEQPEKKTAWYQEAFDADYREVYPHRSDQQAEAEADFALATLKPSKDLPVLDLCCGHGRHSLSFGRRGFRVIGMDLSTDLIHAAAARRIEGALFLRADMRRLPLRPRSFGLVASFFTSFGYFEDEFEDLEVLRGIAQVLHQDGRFLLDFLNALHVRENLVPASTKRSGAWQVNETRRIDEGRGRVIKEVEVLNDDGRRRHYTESVRLYTADDLQRLCVEAGLHIQSVFGGFDGSPHQPSSARTLICGVLSS